MSFEIADSRLPVSRKFELIKDSLLQHDDLPLADVIDCNHWQSVFDQHGIDFGADDDCVYTPAITLWALISQAFFKADLIFDSCTSARGFAPRFLQTLPHDKALALHSFFTSIWLNRGLTPSSK